MSADFSEACLGPARDQNEVVVLLMWLSLFDFLLLPVRTRHTHFMLVPTLSLRNR